MNKMRLLYALAFLPQAHVATGYRLLASSPTSKSNAAKRPGPLLAGGSGDVVAVTCSSSPPEEQQSLVDQSYRSAFCVASMQQPYADMKQIPAQSLTHCRADAHLVSTALKNKRFQTWKTLVGYSQTRNMKGKVVSRPPLLKKQLLAEFEEWLAAGVDQKRAVFVFFASCHGYCAHNEANDRKGALIVNSARNPLLSETVCFFELTRLWKKHLDQVGEKFAAEEGEAVVEVDGEGEEEDGKECEEVVAEVDAEDEEDKKVEAENVMNLEDAEDAPDMAVNEVVEDIAAAGAESDEQRRRQGKEDDECSRNSVPDDALEDDEGEEEEENNDDDEVENPKPFDHRLVLVLDSCYSGKIVKHLKDLVSTVRRESRAGRWEAIGVEDLNIAVQSAGDARQAVYETESNHGAVR
ncbi:unnamed protein product [Amoebophrya sp. A25]|nr:unnamed protein product [Amoebophrya sp. A25]|eukprot:GSA25T00002720001.1